MTDADDTAILDLYRRAFALVLPSVYRDCYGNTQSAPELMGFSLLEAMACGTPAICSRVGGMPEYVRDGEDPASSSTTPAELTEQLRPPGRQPGAGRPDGTPGAAGDRSRL